MVGNDFVEEAKPDGYTVLIAITQIIQAPSLVPNLPYDVFKDLAPGFFPVGLSTIVLAVPEAQPVEVGQGTDEDRQGQCRQATLWFVRATPYVSPLWRATQEERGASTL